MNTNPTVTNPRHTSKASRNPATKIDAKAPTSSVAKLESQSAAALAQERRLRSQWQWLSFVNQTGFLGGAIIWAHGIQTAVLRARELNISRGFRAYPLGHR